MKTLDNIEIPDLDALLADVGGLEIAYKKLLSYAVSLLTSARIACPNVRYFHTLNPDDLVQYAIERLLTKGPEGKRPYYALRNFMANRIRADKRSPKVNTMVAPPVGRNGEEWNEFFESREAEGSDPAENAANNEVEAACSHLIDQIKDEFSEDEEVLNILLAMECGICSRKEIMAEMNISGPIYDRAIKRLQRRTIGLKGELKYATQ